MRYRPLPPPFSRWFRRFSLPALLLLVAGVMGLWPLQAQSAGAQPRIVVLINHEKKHQNEFDHAFSTLGWEAEKVVGTASEVAALAERLDEVDLVLIAPLFCSPQAIDFPAESAAKFRQFIEKGGSLVVTDGSYEPLRQWLAAIDPNLGGLETGKCNSSPWAVLGATTDATPPSSYRFFPNKITQGNSWPHFQKLAAKSQWAVVADCSEGFPVSLSQRVGKGRVFLSALRQTTPAHLENFYANYLLDRAGLELKAFELPEASVGEREVQLEFNRLPQQRGGRFVVEVTPEKGKAFRVERPVSLKVAIPFRYTDRGAATTRLIYLDGGRETVLFSKQVEVPPLLKLKANDYRGILSTARRFPTVAFSAELAPDREKLARAKVTFTLLDAKRRKVSEAVHTVENDAVRSIRQPMALDQKLPAGDYTLRAVLEQNGRLLADESTPLRLLAPRASQTIPDVDHTLLVAGEPFYPVGIYHVVPDEYPRMAEIGFNTVQYWMWHDGKNGIDAAHEHGLKVIYEFNHNNEKIWRDRVASYGEHPSLLMWYGTDEPDEGAYQSVLFKRDTLHDADPHHPVYMVSVRVDIFEKQHHLADVFAPDPYGSTEKVLDWMTRAQEAVKGAKPVIAVLGSFGTETPEVLRASAYIAMAKDARGILWYPWSQAGGGPVGIGLKNHPELQEEVTKVVGEIKALTPALTATRRVPFEAADRSVVGIFCDEGEASHLLLVNVKDEKVTKELTIPEGQTLNGVWKDRFNEKAPTLSVRNGRLMVTLEPYETRAYSSK